MQSVTSSVEDGTARSSQFRVDGNATPKHWNRKWYAGRHFTFATQHVQAVPLVACAEQNEAWKINDLGEVVGVVWGGAIPPGGGWGFYWAGAGSVPQLVSSLTSDRAFARRLNNYGELVGESWFQDASIGDRDRMTLWLPDGEGGFEAVDLNSKIPSKPSLKLGFATDINDDGWMVSEGVKRSRGSYSHPGMLIVPNRE